MLVPWRVVDFKILLTQTPCSLLKNHAISDFKKTMDPFGFLLKNDQRKTHQISNLEANWPKGGFENNMVPLAYGGLGRADYERALAVRI